MKLSIFQREDSLIHQMYVRKVYVQYRIIYTIIVRGVCL